MPIFKSAKAALAKGTAPKAGGARSGASGAKPVSTAAGRTPAKAAGADKGGAGGRTAPAKKASPPRKEAASPAARGGNATAPRAGGGSSKKVAPKSAPAVPAKSQGRTPAKAAGSKKDGAGTKAAPPQKGAATKKAAAGTPVRAVAKPGEKKAQGTKAVGKLSTGAAALPVIPPIKAGQIPGMDAKFLGEQKDLLVAERATYLEQAQQLKDEADSLAMEMEPGDIQFDEESGEGGNVPVDREVDLMLSAQALAEVEEIDAALAKIKAKTYGACERCHQPIPKARLKAIPHARLCVSCKSGSLVSRR